MAKELSTIIARAWSDPDFKARLVNDPASVLAEAGVAVPQGVTFKVLEDTADTQHLVLPVGPANNDEISLDDLEHVAGGLAVESNNTLAC